MTLKQEAKKQKAGIIQAWKKRKRRWDFVRRNLKKISSLSTAGWPKMTNNPDYLKWLDIVYRAKELGIYSLNTANCDIIANMKNKAKDLQKKSYAGTKKN